MARLRFSGPAIDDLRAIGNFIAHDSPDAARRVIARIRKQCESLKASPFLGRPRTEFGVELRSVPVKPFVVFYRVRDSGSIIEVVRIVDGRRDLQTVFAE